MCSRDISRARSSEAGWEEVDTDLFNRGDFAGNGSSRKIAKNLDGFERFLSVSENSRRHFFLVAFSLRERIAGFRGIEESLPVTVVCRE